MARHSSAQCSLRKECFQSRSKEGIIHRQHRYLTKNSSDSGASGGRSSAYLQRLTFYDETVRHMYRQNHYQKINYDCGACLERPRPDLGASNSIS